MNTQDILNRISALCKERNWSIAELTSVADLSENTIYQWYNGKKKPSLPCIEKICDAFGISLAMFFAEDAQERREATMQELLTVFDGLNEEQQDALIDVAKLLQRNK